MKNSKFSRAKRLLALCLIAAFTACDSSENPTTDQRQIAIDAQALQAVLKYEPGDPIIQTAVESEFFEVSGLKDNVIEGEDGAVLFIPKGAFVDAKGNPVEKSITIEIAEASTLDEMLASGLSTKTSNGMLEADRMLYVNATADGEQLFIDPDHPVSIDLPSESAAADQLVFKGVRGEDGQVHWISPEKPRQYLTPVPIEQLDFLPKGFEEEVLNGLPFKGYTALTDQLVDSLYYSCVHSGQPDNVYANIEPGLYSDYSESLMHNWNILKLYDEAHDRAAHIFGQQFGVDPAQIKVLRGGKFENSLIATTAFEQRLQTLFFYHNAAPLIDLYVNNLDKDLWEIDQMVLDSLTIFFREVSGMTDTIGTGQLDEAGFKLPADNEIIKRYKAFVAEKLTNVKDFKPSTKSLSEYYAKELAKNQRQLQVLQDKLMVKRAKKDAKAEKVVARYTKLLKKREQYRMNKFGFELKAPGWIATGTEIAITDLETFTLNIAVPDAKSYDRTHVYTVTPRIKSLFSLRSIDTINFAFADARDPFLLLHKGETAVALSVSYKGEQAYVAISPFSQKKVVNVTLAPHPVSAAELKAKLHDFTKKYSRENRIEKDLKFQLKFYEEDQRRAAVYNERVFKSKLLLKAYPSQDGHWGYYQH
jgi:hypothetical protein